MIWFSTSLWWHRAHDTPQHILTLITSLFETRQYSLQHLQSALQTQRCLPACLPMFHIVRVFWQTITRAIQLPEMVHLPLHCGTVAGSHFHVT